MSEFEDLDINLDGAEDVLAEEVNEEPEETGEDLDTLNEGEEQPQEEPDSEPRKEPGYVQGRISKAVSKVEEKYEGIIGDITSKYEARLQALEDRYAPVLERMQEMEAQDLVRNRKVADMDTARELVRLRYGQPATPQPQQVEKAPAKPAQDPAVQARVAMLDHQRERIEANGGPDVVAEFTSNPEVNAKVKSGEWDFYDVADYLKQKSSRKKPPTPMRSPNGASGKSPNAIDSMSDEQFDRMERKIKEGARYRLS